MKEFVKDKFGAASLKFYNSDIDSGISAYYYIMIGLDCAISSFWPFKHNPNGKSLCTGPTEIIGSSLSFNRLAQEKVSLDGIHCFAWKKWRLLWLRWHKHLNGFVCMLKITKDCLQELWKYQVLLQSLNQILPSWKSVRQSSGKRQEESYFQPCFSETSRVYCGPGGGGSTEGEIDKMHVQNDSGLLPKVESKRLVIFCSAAGDLEGYGALVLQD